MEAGLFSVYLLTVSGCLKLEAPEDGRLLIGRNEVEAQHRDEDADRATGQCRRTAGRLNVRSAVDCGHRNKHADYNSHYSAVSGIFGLIGQICSTPWG